MSQAPLMLSLTRKCLARMAELTPIKIASQPGCKRDGTLLEGDNNVDNQWCRYQMRKGLPRKIGGVRRLSNELSGISRGLNVFNRDNKLYTHSGWSDGLDSFQIDLNGNVIGFANRTPVGFAADPLDLWQFDQMFDGTATTTVLLAHAAPNLADISADTAAPVYSGGITLNTPLVATGSPNVSGGVFALGPYGVSYGSDGVVNYSPINNVAGGWTTLRPTGAKLVFALPIRAGAGNGPSGLIWGVSVLLRMTFVGGATVFNFDQISTGYSLLSSQSVIEYDGIYYWPGIDHFLSFNGVIQEVENSMNLNWFYDNLNYTHAQKVFAMKVPRWGEIWWCYPRGNAAECTHAIIYNVRLSRIFGYSVWYDTKLPMNGWTAAQYAQVFRRPIVSGVDVDTTTSKYRLWETEFQTDIIDGNSVGAIQSYFETNAIWPAEQQGQKNNGLYVEYIEPDFIQSGDMTVQILGSMSNARAPDNANTPQSFPDTATSSDNQVVYIRDQRRQLRFRFESNVVGGDYQMGDCVAQVRPGDSRITS